MPDREAPIVNGRAVPSAEASNLLGGSHGVASRALLLGADLTRGIELPLLKGSITCDSGNMVRRTGTIEILGAWSDDPTSQLSPTGGARIKVQRGIQLTDRSIEWITLGTLRVVKAAQSSDDQAAKTTLTLKDEMSTLARDRFDANTSTDTTLTVVAQITALIRRTLPGATVTDLTGSTRLAGKLDMQLDPVGGIEKLARSIGAVCYCGRGAQEFMIVPQPGLDDPPRWVLSVGEGGNLISVDRERDADRTYNRVLAKGQTDQASTGGTTAPVPYGEARITDPADPLFYGGRYGRVTRFYVSPLLKTNEQCTAAAASMLEDARGAEASISFTSLVNPALDGDDVVLSYLSDRKRRTHIADSVTHPLSISDAQAITGRTLDLPDEQQQDEATA